MLCTHWRDGRMKNSFAFPSSQSHLLWGLLREYLRVQKLKFYSSLGNGGSNIPSDLTWITKEAMCAYIGTQCMLVPVFPCLLKLELEWGMFGKTSKRICPGRVGGPGMGQCVYFQRMTSVTKRIDFFRFSPLLQGHGCCLEECKSRAQSQPGRSRLTPSSMALGHQANSCVTVSQSLPQTPRVIMRKTRSYPCPKCRWHSININCYCFGEILILDFWILWYSFI